MPGRYKGELLAHRLGLPPLQQASRQSWRPKLKNSGICKPLRGADKGCEFTLLCKHLRLRCGSSFLADLLPKIRLNFMDLITCQHEWVKQRQLSYKCEPPEGYWFEDAHYPLSKKLGGTSTVRLWYPDHIVHGVLQTLEYNYPCIYSAVEPKESAIIEEIYPEYLELYRKAYYFCKSFAGKSTHKEKDSSGKSVNAQKAAEVANFEKNEEGKSINAVKGAKELNKEKDENGKSINAVKGGKAGGKRGGKSAAKIQHSQRWKCLVTGYITTPGPLSRYQNKRGIDTSLRVRIQ